MNFKLIETYFRIYIKLLSKWAFNVLLLLCELLVTFKKNSLINKISSKIKLALNYLLINNNRVLILKYTLIYNFMNKRNQFFVYTNYNRVSTPISSYYVVWLEIFN